MKALKVILHQNTAVYRNPITAEVIESYPLPPPSTVLGFIHSIIKEKEPEAGSMNLSIQGKYTALFRDYQWYKKYNKKIKGFDRQPKPIIVHTLYDLCLILHFYFAEQSLAKKIEKALYAPPYFPYIGRAEDLVKIEKIKWVSCESQIKENGFLQYNAYINSEAAHQLNLHGVLYKLPGYYKFISVTAKKETRIFRSFDWLDLYYIEENAYYESDSTTGIWFDEEGDQIWWCMPSPMEKL